MLIKHHFVGKHPKVYDFFFFCCAWDFLKTTKLSEVLPIFGKHFLSFTSTEVTMQTLFVGEHLKGRVGDVQTQNATVGWGGVHAFLYSYMLQ